MATLLIRLEGPMQSWGTRSRFDDRDTEAEPSKSGVLGLTAAALGLDRAEPIDHLAALQFGVRVDREGVVRTDYHTAQLFPGLPDNKERQLEYLDKLPPHIRREKKQFTQKDIDGNTSQTWRRYLADAAFWAALSGERELLEDIQAALKNPHWPLSLGRKAFQPSQPLWWDGGVQEGDLLEVLRAAPSLRRERDGLQAPYRYVVDKTAVTGDTRQLSPALRRDDPTAPFAERRYALRDVWMFSEAPKVLEASA